MIRIHMLSGPSAGEQVIFDVSREYTFGRSPQADCCLPEDKLVSRMHACLVADVEANTLGIRDLGSTNGFRINNVPTAGKANPREDVIPLADGDELMIGKLRMRVHIEQATENAITVEPPDDINAATIDGDSVPGTRHMGRRRRDTVGFSGYTLQDQIGSGGMGVVYRATCDADNRAVAIKIMKNSVVTDQKTLDMFQREIEVTKSLRHPNIIRYWDSGCVDSAFYLVLEFAGGGTLADMMSASLPGCMDMNVAIELFKQSTDAMSYAHSKSMVHRDLKPSNVLIDNAGPAPVAKIADLGLAKNFDTAGMSGMTATFTRGGTMAYMPPEQLSEFRDVKPSADVFSLAATFYEALTGKIVYNFKDGVSPFITIAECRIHPPRDINPSLPENVATVLEKALKKDPGDRYPTAGAMLAAMYDNGFFG